jgi:two-component sensor histidine kinase
MLSKSVFILFTFLGACSAFSQDLGSINKEIQKIDSLIVYSQYTIAEKKADSLFAIIENTTHQEQILNVQLQRAKVLDFKEKHTQALSMYLDILSKSERYNLNQIVCETNILISLIHEKNNNLDLAYTYIKTALEECEKFNLYKYYSTILIRLSSIHRVIIRFPESINPNQIKKLEKKGFKASLDSTIQYAKQAIPYAQKFNNDRDLNDAYFLIGACYSYQNKKREAIEYYEKLIPYFKKLRDYEMAFFHYNNVSKIYLDLKEPLNALKNSDSAYRYYHKVPFSQKQIYPLQRSKIFHFMNKNDSAYHYLQIAFNDSQELSNRQKDESTKKLEEQYQSDKKEETIRNKNNLIALIIGFLSVILIASVLIVNKNRQINTQNKIIRNQVIDLKKTLEQKQVLLSELQHRVKNNLQYVISILEIQKESIEHNNLEDLIKSNQNRIHSIALLHKKLNVSESVNDIDLKRYITDLSELVKDSYDNKLKNVSMFITCTIETFPISKALPLGLIIVELVSNSMKHAFKNQKNGIINIEITHDENLKKNCLHYIDNGEGFDFVNVETKGLGVEIMKGLIDQLNGKLNTYLKKGFELKIYF